MSILYRSDEPRAAAWASYFAKHAPDLDFRVWPAAGDLSEIEYLIAWQVPPEFLDALPRLKVLFSSGAGIDHVDFSAVPAHIPIVRMVEPGIVNGMVEYVSLAVLALHRDFFDYVEAKAAQVWDPLEVPPAPARTIGVMGMGVPSDAPFWSGWRPMASGCAAGIALYAKWTAWRVLPVPISCSPSSSVATS
jgi:glyoxylate/hydroxypyruvate reductase